MIGWTLGKIAPNLTNIIRKMWSTRMVTMPTSWRGTSGRIRFNKPATLKMPVGFTKAKVPFEQTYSYQSKLGGIAYQAPKFQKGGAKFLPKDVKVSPSIAGEKIKAVGKLSIAGTTGTALGYASSQRQSTKAGLAPPKFQKTKGWGTPSGKFGKAEKRVSTIKGSDRFSSGSYRAPSKQGLATKVMTRPSIASYKSRFIPKQTAPKAKVPVAKVAKTAVKVSTPVSKMASTSRAKDVSKKVSRTIPIATTAASKSATKAGILTAKIIRKFGITQEQVRASDVSQKKRLLGSGTIKGPKATTGFKSPFAGDIAKTSASGYHIFKKDSAGAKSFRAAHKAAKGKKFKWKGTGKWYSGA